MAEAWYLLPAKTKNETLIIAMSWQKFHIKAWDNLFVTTA